MKFVETSLKGVFLVESEVIEDGRGFFARSWCEEEFKTAGLVTEIAQANISFNYHSGTIRGMHFQDSPYSEVKLVRCTQGAVFDVVIDIRTESPTYGQWFGANLLPERCNGMYVPAGCAHGFQTLADNSEVHYLMSSPYNRDSSNGLRYDDPAFGIAWPKPAVAVSEKDLSWPVWIAKS